MEPVVLTMCFAVLSLAICLAVICVVTILRLPRRDDQWIREQMQAQLWAYQEGRRSQRDDMAPAWPGLPMPANRPIEEDIDPDALLPEEELIGRNP